MKKELKFVMLFLLIIVFGCGLSYWAQTSPVVDDYGWIYDRDTEDDLVYAFATALRINHPAAYDMIDPTLEPRLEEWMNSHQSKKCKRIPDFFQSGIGTKQGSSIVLDCLGYSGTLRFEVDNIVVKVMKVIDWGEVIETGS